MDILADSDSITKLIYDKTFNKKQIISTLNRVFPAFKTTIQQKIATIMFAIRKQPGQLIVQNNLYCHNKQSYI